MKILTCLYILEEDCNDPGSLSCFNVAGLAERSVAERVTRFPHTCKKKQPDIALLPWHLSDLEGYCFVNHKEVPPVSFTTEISQAHIHDHGRMDSSNNRSDADLTCLNMEAKLPIFFC